MIVLVDDDALIRMTWEMAAKKANLELKSYDSFNALMAEISQYTHETTFYFDSQLGENIRGEIEAQKLYDLGFEKLYLCSGLTFKPEDLPHYVLAALSKRPPF